MGQHTAQAKKVHYGGHFEINTSAIEPTFYGRTKLLHSDRRVTRARRWFHQIIIYSPCNIQRWSFWYKQLSRLKWIQNAVHRELNIVSNLDLITDPRGSPLFRQNQKQLSLFIKSRNSPRVQRFIFLPRMKSSHWLVHLNPNIITWHGRRRQLENNFTAYLTVSWAPVSWPYLLSVLK